MDANKTGRGEDLPKSGGQPQQNELPPENISTEDNFFSTKIKISQHFDDKKEADIAGSISPTIFAR